MLDDTAMIESLESSLVTIPLQHKKLTAYSPQAPDTGSEAPVNVR